MYCFIYQVEKGGGLIEFLVMMNGMLDQRAGQLPRLEVGGAQLVKGF